MGKKKLTSDGIYSIDDWSMGATNVGSVIDTATVDFGDIGRLQTEFNYDQDLRDKYPALKDAWDHYNNVKKMCEAKEQEDEN
jgi:hypothetical protein